MPPVSDVRRWWHLPLFSLGLLAFVLVSRSGVSLTRIYVFLAFYVVASLPWILAEVRAWHCADFEPVLGKARAWGALSVGVALAGIGAWKSQGGLLAIGVALFYIGVGALIEWQRWPAGMSTWRSVIVLAVGCGGLAGFAALTPHFHPAAIAAALALLILIPLGLNVLAGRLIDALQVTTDRGTTTWWTVTEVWRVRVIATTGAIVVVGCTVGLGFAAHTWKAAVWVAVGAAVVMFTVVSEAQLDIVLVVAVVGLLAATRPEVGLTHADRPSQGTHVLVAFGDSYMSGEGARVFFRGTNEGGGDQCRQAPTAWAVRAATATTANVPHYDGLEFLACSGATTTNIDHDAQKPNTSETQLQQYHADERSRLGPFAPMFAVVSLGGNDAGFSTIGRTCLAPGDCAPILKDFEGNLPVVGTDLVRSYEHIRTTVGMETPVVAIPYPSPIDVNGQCGQLALTPDERRAINQLLNDLDDEVRHAAHHAGLLYAGSMKDSLLGHQLCDPSPGINFLHLYSLQGVADQRFNPENWIHDSLHPSEVGHGLMLRAFDSWLQAHPFTAWRRDAHHEQRELPPETLASKVFANHVCDLKMCKAAANKWAIEQLAKRVWEYGAIPLGIVLGFLLLWSSLFGRFKEPHSFRRWRANRWLAFIGFDPVAINLAANNLADQIIENDQLEAATQVATDRAVAQDQTVGNIRTRFGVALSVSTVIVTFTESLGQISSIGDSHHRLHGFEQVALVLIVVLIALLTAAAQWPHNWTFNPGTDIYGLDDAMSVDREVFLSLEVGVIKNNMQIDKLLTLYTICLGLLAIEVIVIMIALV